MGRSRSRSRSRSPPRRLSESGNTATAAADETAAPEAPDSPSSMTDARESRDRSERNDEGAEKRVGGCSLSRALTYSRRSKQNQLLWWIERRLVIYPHAHLHTVCLHHHDCISVFLYCSSLPWCSQALRRARSCCRCTGSSVVIITPKTFSHATCQISISICTHGTWHGTMGRLDHCCLLAN